VPIDDRDDDTSHFKRSPTGPWVTPPRAPGSSPPRAPINPPRAPAPRAGRRGVWSVVIFVLLMSGVAIRAYRDLSRPDAWAYWKDQYVSPSLTATLVPKLDLDPTGQARPALAVRGTIGAAAAGFLREKIDDAHLAPGDLILLASPGGDLGQAIIMGEIIRSHGLVTAVGTVDQTREVKASSCASACVMVYAGGVKRFGVRGSMLGVHRFVTSSPTSDPVADAQRTTGTVLHYLGRMGVSSTVVEAMSQTGDVRWLGTKEAVAMNLITDPLGGP
jgi:hypothetical protein